MQEIVSLEGHIIDSDLLRKAMTRIVEEGAEFEVLEFRVGRTNEERSFAKLAVRAADPHALDRVLEALSYLGATSALGDARFLPAEADGVLPDEFYATSNYPTFARVDGRWLEALDQKMDCALVLRDGTPRCVKQRLVRAGEPVALRGSGIRLRPPERPRAAAGFGFMHHEISAEVNKELAIRAAAQAMRDTRAEGRRIVMVVGPAVVHSGGDAALERLVRGGWVDAVLTGNAFAVHDLEKALLQTSLGVCQTSGRALEGGSRNHLWTINAVNRAGGVAAAVRGGIVPSGVMRALVETGKEYVLAGSIRDDGPLKEVITDVLDAQSAYMKALEGAGMCLMLASTLHGIAVGNLLPASVRTVCVDMNESVPVKLANRGTLHAVGLVTDVGFFLGQLEAELAKPASSSVR